MKEPVKKEFYARLYTVQIEDGTLQRNCRELILMPTDQSDQHQVESSSMMDGTKTRNSQTFRQIYVN